MNANEVAWPTGMSDQDPTARGRPLVFDPQGFLVKRAIRGLADHQVLHFRHYGHDRQDDLHIG